MLDDAIRAQDVPRVSELLAEMPTLARGAYATATSPLHIAVGVTGNREIIELLIEYGADLEAVCKDTGATPLKYAIVFTKLDLIPVLVGHGAELDGDENGENTPLELAQSLPSEELRNMGVTGTREQYREAEQVLRRLGAVV